VESQSHPALQATFPPLFKKEEEKAASSPLKNQ